MERKSTTIADTDLRFRLSCSPECAESIDVWYDGVWQAYTPYVGQMHAMVHIQVNSIVSILRVTNDWLQIGTYGLHYPVGLICANRLMYDTCVFDRYTYLHFHENAWLYVIVQYAHTTTMQQRHISRLLIMIRWCYLHYTVCHVWLHAHTPTILRSNSNTSDMY